MTVWAGVDWSLAPSWATHWAMDEDGRVFWFGLEVSWAQVFGGWIPSNRYAPAPDFNYLGHPSDSLTLRPQKEATP